MLLSSSTPYPFPNDALAGCQTSVQSKSDLKCLKIQSCLKMWFSTSVDITWYAEAAIYGKNLFLSHSIVSWLSFVSDTGEVVQQNWQSVINLNGVKNTIMQATYFLNGPMFNLLFHCYIIERKWLLMRNLVIILPSKSKLCRTF